MKLFLICQPSRLNFYLQLENNSAKTSSTNVRGVRFSWHTWNGSLLHRCCFFCFFIRVCAVTFPKSTTCICHRVAAVYYSEWATRLLGGPRPACHIQLLSKLCWLISPTRGQYRCESEHRSTSQTTLLQALALRKRCCICFVWVVLCMEDVCEVESVGYHAHTLGWPTALMRKKGLSIYKPLYRDRWLYLLWCGVQIQLNELMNEWWHEYAWYLPV